MLGDRGAQHKGAVLAALVAAQPTRAPCYQGVTGTAGAHIRQPTGDRQLVGWRQTWANHRALKRPILVSNHCARNMAPTQSATTKVVVSLAATTRPCISMPWIWSDRCSACTRTPSSSSRAA